MVRKCPAGDPAQKQEARRVRDTMRGKGNDAWASPIILSLSKGSYRNASKGVEANDAEDEGPGLFGDEAGAGSLAAE